MKYEIKISPVAKPRMTRQDKWKKRKATTVYWSFKDDLAGLCEEAGYKLETRLYAVFYVEMPKSWTAKKKKLMKGARHEDKPDADNYAKAVMDCLKSEGDSMITPVCVHKVWAETPSIIFFDTLKEWYDCLTELGHD